MTDDALADFCGDLGRVMVLLGELLGLVSRERDLVGDLIGDLVGEEVDEDEALLGFLVGDILEVVLLGGVGADSPPSMAFLAFSSSAS